MCTPLICLIENPVLFICFFILNDYRSEEDTYVPISVIEQRRREERLARIRDAQSAHLKNQMGKYGGTNLHHRRRYR